MVKPLVFVVLLAFAASAQSRGPVVPNFQQPEKQAAAPAAAPAKADESIDLVGPTEAQKQRAKDAAAALAKADAEAKAAVEKKARDEAEAKAKVELAAKLAAEKKAHDEAEAKAKVLRDEAEAKAKAEAAAKLAAETKARTEAEALAREDAEKRAKLEAELKLKEEAAAKAQAELAAAEKARRDGELAAQLKAKSEAVEKARAEAQAQEKAQAEAQAARKQTFADAQARAKAAAEEAKKKAAEAAQAKKLADAEARAAARAVLEAKKAEAFEKAHAKAMLAQRKRDEAKCRGKNAEACLDAVATKYTGRGLSLPAAAPAPASDALAIAPLVPASSGERRVLVPSSSGAPVVALTAAPATYAAAAAPAAQKASGAAGSPGVVVAVATQSLSGAQPPLASSRGFVAVPRDEAPQHRARALQVDNQLQVGPDQLILDRLEARGELVPGSVQLDFGYRFAMDDAAAAHHLFSAGLESGTCSLGEACGARWFLRGGFGPRNAASYSVSRKVGTAVGNHTDTLGWSANVLQAGAGFTGATFSFLGDAQLEALSAEYLRNVDQAGPLRETGDLKQIRLRGTLGGVNGPWSAQLRVAGFFYAGDDPATLKDVPLRGALIDDDLPGLAGAPQSMSARLEGGWEAPTGTSLRLSYGYLSYVGPVWSSAHLFAGGLAQKFGHFRLGGGVVVEQEQDAKGNSYPTVFGTVTLGASF